MFIYCRTSRETFWRGEDLFDALKTNGRSRNGFTGEWDGTQLPPGRSPNVPCVRDFGGVGSTAKIMRVMA
jgi:hypothetical protein